MAKVSGADQLAALRRSFTYVSSAQEAGEGMVMIDTRTFAILTAMAAMWVEDAPS